MQNSSSLETQDATVVFVEYAGNGNFDVGVDFTRPNPSFWGVTFPSDDWTPAHPDAKQFDERVIETGMHRKAASANWSQLHVGSFIAAYRGRVSKIRRLRCVTNKLSFSQNPVDSGQQFALGASLMNETLSASAQSFLHYVQRIVHA